MRLGIIMRVGKHATVDELYLHVHIVPCCAHELKPHGLTWIGVANKNSIFTMLVGLAKRFKAKYFDDVDGLVVLTSCLDA